MKRNLGTISLNATKKEAAISANFTDSSINSDNRDSVALPHHHHVHNLVKTTTETSPNAIA